MDNFKKNSERVFLILPYGNTTQNQDKIDEIISLSESAGGEVLGFNNQNVKEISPSTYIGEGKLYEIANQIEGLNIDVAIFDGQLSPAQSNNISDALGGIKVIDRSALILDIFAQRAQTSEGKLQVELAQLEYIYPRLKGQGSMLSRLGGGIGTRGPGETQLETDKRHIRRRIKYLKEQIEESAKRRTLQSDRRSKNDMFVIALAGYTNAGKSTLLNTLCESDALAEDKLFATLDPTARKTTFGDFSSIVIDTVGFIRDIPTHLIEAFKSTLESITSADLILNVCDASSKNVEQYEITENIIRQIGGKAPIIKVYNKCDKIEDFENFPKDGIQISAKQNKGIKELKEKIEEILKKDYFSCVINLEYLELNKFFSLSKYAEKFNVNYTETGAEISLTIKKINLNKFSTFLKE